MLRIVLLLLLLGVVRQPGKLLQNVSVGSHQAYSAIVERARLCPFFPLPLPLVMCTSTVLLEKRACVCALLMLPLPIINPSHEAQELISSPLKKTFTWTRIVHHSVFFPLNALSSALLVCVELHQ